MKFNILFFFLFLKLYSQNKYTVASVSDKFYFEVYGKPEKIKIGCGRNEISNCKIKIFQKNNKKFLQEVNSDSFIFDIKATKIVVSNSKFEDCNPILIYDFNFDGIKDLAIRNGNNMNDGSNFDFYFYDNKNKKFVKDEQLSTICKEGSGLFEINSFKRKIKVNDGEFMHSYTTVYEYNSKLKTFKKAIEIQVLPVANKIKFIVKNFKDKKSNKVSFFKDDDESLDKIQNKIEQIW